MKRNAYVKLIINSLSSWVLENLTSYHLYNSGKITKIEGERVEVKWPNGNKYYFNVDQLEIDLTPSYTF